MLGMKGKRYASESNKRTNDGNEKQNIQRKTKVGEGCDIESMYFFYYITIKIMRQCT